MDVRVKQFISDLEEICKHHEVELILTDTTYVESKDGIQSTGFFTDEHEETDKPMLMCALGDRTNDYISTLVHESCHLDQWVNNSKFWKNAYSCGAVELWLGGEEIPNIRHHINKVIELELDCEKRTVRKIKKYGLPISTTEYTQKANAYIQFYNFLLESRKWPKAENSPYRNFDVWKDMPNYFREKEYYKKLPRSIRKSFIDNKLNK